MGFCVKLRDVTGKKIRKALDKSEKMRYNKNNSVKRCDGV